MKNSGLSDRLKQARGLRQVTQQDLGKAVGMSKWSIVKYEADQLQPGRDVMHKLAAALSVSPAWLETGRGAMEAGSEGSVEGYKPELMIEIIVAVKDYLEKEGLIIDSARKEGELYTLLYQKFAVKTDKLDPRQKAEVIDLTRLLAQKAG